MDLESMARAGLAGDGTWFAFLGRHQPKLTDVDCPDCGEGKCGCLGVLATVCAEDDEDWYCTVARAFLAGRMSGLRTAAGKLDDESDGQATAARMNLLRRMAAELQNEADRVSRDVEETGARSALGQMTFTG
jgi:hypothetical protein